MVQVRPTWKKVIQQKSFPSKINLLRRFQKLVSSAMRERKSEIILDAESTGETTSVVPIVTPHIS
jgi:hypothetical protein